MAIEKKFVIQVLISMISLGAIVAIEQVLYMKTYDWSESISIEVETKALKTFVNFLDFFGSYWPSLILVSIWVSMFKRRQQAFSYTILICIQIFLSQFFKLVFHEGRPY